MSMIKTKISTEIKTITNLFHSESTTPKVGIKHSSDYGWTVPLSALPFSSPLYLLHSANLSLFSFSYHCLTPFLMHPFSHIPLVKAWSSSETFHTSMEAIEPWPTSLPFSSLAFSLAFLQHRSDLRPASGNAQLETLKYDMILSNDLRVWSPPASFSPVKCTAV